MKITKISDFGIEFIKKLEGLRLEKYNCIAGYQTIGYGHKILPQEIFAQTISYVEAEHLLRKDLSNIECAVLKYITAELNQQQFDAISSFTYNLGVATLQRSTLRQKINYGSFVEAANEFLRWRYIKNKPSLGLLKRRKLERQLFIMQT